MRATAQFSLRTLLVLLTLIAIACGLYVGIVAEDRKQERLVNQAKALFAANHCRWVYVKHGKGIALVVEGAELNLEMARALRAARRITNLGMKSLPEQEVAKELEKSFHRLDERGWKRRRQVRSDRLRQGRQILDIGELTVQPVPHLLDPERRLAG